MCNKPIKKVTNLTLATTLTIGPILSPLMVYANDETTIQFSENNSKLIQEENKTTQTNEFGTNSDTKQKEEQIQKIQQQMDLDSFDLNDWSYTQTGDLIRLYSYIGSSTSIYVPGEYNGKQIILSDLNIFPRTTTHLKLEEINGKKVKLQSSLTTGAFSGNDTIISLDLSGLDTANILEMDYMFKNAKNLTFLNLSGWDTSQVRSMQYMFEGLTGLTSLDLSHFNTSRVTNMRWMFKDSANLESINLNGWDTSNVTNMNSMFEGLKKLTSLDLSHFNTSKVVDMGRMFRWSTNLEFLNISGWDTSNVTDMNSMFYDLEKITSLDLSSFNTSKVTNMKEMFYDMRSLKTLDVSTFDTSNVKNMRSMFAWLQNLTTLDVTHFNTSKVTDMSYMFSGMSSLKKLDVSSFDTSNVTDMSVLFYNSGVENLDLSSFNTSKVTNMRSMFKGMSNLTSLDLSSFDTSNVTNMAGMFEKNTGLKTLDLSSFNTSNVTDMSLMFSGMSSLTSINLANFNTSKVTNMRHMFSYLNQLKTLDLSMFDVANVSDMYGMFYLSESLTVINLSDWKLSNSADITNMFYVVNTTPLLLVTNDETLKKYTFKSHHRTGSRLTLNTNQGAFTDGTTQFKTSEFFIIEGLTEADIQHSIQLLIGNKGTPFRDGYNFDGWELSLNPSNNLDSLFEKLNGTLEAKWNKEPVISANNRVVNVGDYFNPLEGVSAKDLEDGPIPITEEHVFFNNVDTSVPGTYQVIYKVPDSKGLIGTKTINVVVNDKPVIEATNKIIAIGDKANFLDGVTAYDKEDGAILLTEENIIFNNVNPSIAGTYQVTYQVSDSNQLTTTKTIEVVVKEMNVIQAEDQVINVGDSFNPLEVVNITSSEDLPNELTLSNVIANTVNPTTAGTYRVSYHLPVSDDWVIAKTITVVVNGLPVIHVKKQTLTIGEPFDPLKFVSFIDTEDGEIILNENNVIFNNVNPYVIGTYEVRYQVADSLGGQVTETVVIEVLNAFKTFTYSTPTISSTTITGKGDVGAKVGIYLNGKRLDITTVDSKGNYQLTIPKQKAGTILTIKQAKSGYETLAKEVTVLNEFKTFTIKNASASSVAIYGTGEPGANVKAFVNGEAISSLIKVNSKGNYKIVIPKQKAGTVVQVKIAKDGYKTISKTTTILNELKTFTYNTPSTSTTTISGKGVAGAKVGVYTSNGKRLAITTVNSKGNYQLTIPKQKAGTILTLKQAKSGYQTLAKELTVLKEFKTFTLKKVSTSSVAIYGTGEPGANVKAFVNGKAISSLTRVNSKGNYKIVIPKQKAGTVVEVKMAKRGYQTLSQKVKVTK